MAGLAAVHLPAHYPLGVLHGDAPLGVGDKHDEHHQSQHPDDDQGDESGMQSMGTSTICAIRPVRHAADNRGHHGGAAGDDTSEQNNGDPVADAELGDLFTQPHDKGGTGHKSGDDHDGRPYAVAFRHVEHGDTVVVVVVDPGVVAKALEQGNAHGGVAGDGRQLALALLAALLLHPLQGRDGDGQQLDDDGGVDIGLDGQGKQSRLGERVAAHHAQQAENSSRLLLHIVRQCIPVDKGHRDGAAHPEDEQGEDGEQDLIAQLLHLPRVSEGLNHLRSPPPYRLPFRSSLWRRRRTRTPGP